MRSRILVCLGIVLLAAMTEYSLAGVATAEAAVAGTAADRPIAVSPGSAAHVALIADRCPTFSWGGVAEARGYELVVYGVAAGGGAVEVLRKSFPAAVGSWTPALGGCLAPGEQYAWSVRALGPEGASEWSAPALLEVTAAAGRAEFLEALAVVRRYLEANPGAAALAAAPAEAPVNEPARQAAAASHELRAPAPTELSVNGGVVAASFTGEGSTLTDLDPANLAAGTAAIDISGTAAIASDVVGAACISESELDFDTATQAEMTAHAGTADAHREHATLEESAEIDTEIAAHAALADVHHTPPTMLPPTGAAGGELTGTYPNPGVVATIARDSEVTSEIGAHSGLPNVHHTPTVDTVLTEAQVEGFITDDPLDMGNNPITNIGAAGTDFTASGGMTFADDVRINADLGIGADPLPGSERNIYMYDGGIYSDPRLYISGHNSGFITLERRRTDSSIYTMRAGCGSVNCTDDFSIAHSTAGTCLAIRDGCEVEIPQLELDVTDSPDTCDGTTEARLYYDASLDEPCFCNGTNWMQLDGGGTC